MKIAYLDCASGISGDMTLGALVDAGVDLDELNRAVESLGLPGCRLVAEEVRKKGFRAVQVTVQHEAEHVHRHLREILKLIDGGRMTDRQRDTARRIFTRLGQAEAKAHGVPIEKVHFHEVGAADSIADIVGSAVAWDLLDVDRIVASPVVVGSGRVKIAHGLCSVPAPAVVELLRGVPLAESSVAHELTTPTGAAILAELVDSFGPLPSMTIQRTGVGAGRRDLDEQANVLRILVGEMDDDADENESRRRVWVLETNLDDISGEAIGYCVARLWEADVLDVYTTAIQMKKNRPGVKVSVLCEESRIEAAESILFRETTTLGVRRWPVDRHVLRRRRHEVQTEWGPIDGKLGFLDDGTVRFSPEFESCRQVAEKQGLPLQTVFEAARRAFDAKTL